MTDEQIEEKALEYSQLRHYSEEELFHSITSPEEVIRLAFIAGAHSRDEEIEELEMRIKSLSAILFEERLENQSLRNPWISVEERLPEEGKDILLSYDNGNIVRVGCVRIGDINFIKNHIQYYMCWMETPKPELKKGE